MSIFKIGIQQLKSFRKSKFYNSIGSKPKAYMFKRFLNLPFDVDSLADNEIDVHFWWWSRYFYWRRERESFEWSFIFLEFWRWCFVVPLGVVLLPVGTYCTADQVKKGFDQLLLCMFILRFPTSILKYYKSRFGNSFFKFSFLFLW